LTGSTPELDLIIMDECTNVLEKLDDLSDASYIKALNKFKDADRRRMFMKMSFTRSWLKSLE
jgi:hypothetical protein